MLGSLHHIGLVVSDVDAWQIPYAWFDGKRLTDETFGARFRVVHPPESVPIELIQWLEPEGRKIGLRHLAYRARGSLDVCCNNLRYHGWMPVQEPRYAALWHTTVAFYLQPNGLLVEIVA